MNNATGNLPTPDFSYDPTTDLRAGLRPYRKDAICLEAKTMGDKLVVHNYGHGGAGITLAPGSALEVWDFLSASGRASAGTEVAVLGGGVIGLTVAALLSSRGLKVTIFADKFEDTTSDVAGGQWAPSVVADGKTAKEKEIFDRVVRTSYTTYFDLIGQGYGVKERDNYSWVELSSFRKVPTDLVPPPQRLRLPFENHAVNGYLYKTMLVETPILLQRLRSDTDGPNIVKIKQTFHSPQDVQSLPQGIVVNCMGLGSRDVWPDSRLEAKKGQLILLKAQPALQYLYSGHGYIFPREDCVVVGGTVEREGDFSDADPVPSMCAQIIGRHKSAFGTMGMQPTAEALPAWFITDK